MIDFDEFYLGSRTRLLRAITLVAESQEDAADCLQEAYVRAASRWSSLRSDSAEAWVRRVALNLALDGRRRSRTRRATGRAVGPPAPAAAPDARTVDVVRAVRALPRPQQEVVALHYLLDLPVEQVARELQRPENTVKTQLARARQRLTEALALDLEPARD